MMAGLTPRPESRWQGLAPGTKRSWRAAFGGWPAAEAAYLQGEHLTAGQRRHGTRPRRVTAANLSELPRSERETRRRSLDAVGRVRNGVPLERAAREAGTTPDAVRRYAGPALEKQGGRWAAKPIDRLARRQVTTIIDPATGRWVEAVVETSSSLQSSEIALHNSDIGAWLSARTSPAVKRKAKARIERRHGKRAGRRAFLPDGTVVDHPRFFGEPDGVIELSEEIDLGDLDYGSDTGAA
jgi:hypothetical protein